MLFFFAEYKQKLSEVAFQEFIFSILQRECGEDNCKINGKESNFYFDILLQNGLKPFTNAKTCVETNNSNDLEKMVRHFDECKKMCKCKLCIICKVSKNFIKDDYLILGLPFLKKMAKKHTTLWWQFITSYDPDGEIRISRNGKDAILESSILKKEFNIDCRLKLKEIDKISVANQLEFIRLIKNKNKEPAIIAGNGISIPFGSDQWSVLAYNIFDYLYPHYIDNPQNVKNIIGNSTYSLTSLPKKTLPKKHFNLAIKHCVYRKYIKESMHVNTTLLHSVVKAKKKRPTMPLVTYNYDCFIEDDFKLHYPKFDIKTVYDYATDQQFTEPKIVHVHGFIPNSESGKLDYKIVLTDDEYFRTYINSTEWAPKIQLDILENKLCLFVGSSLSDVFQMSLIENVRVKMLKNKGGFLKNSWKCFALMCFHDLSPKDKLTLVSYYMRKGIYVIFSENFSDLPSIFDKLMNNK